VPRLYQVGSFDEGTLNDERERHAAGQAARGEVLS
jgi:hypothetical protein